MLHKIYLTLIEQYQSYNANKIASRLTKIYRLIATDNLTPMEFSLLSQ